MDIFFKYLILVLQTSALVLARKRGIRKPRYHMHSSRQPDEFGAGLFQGHEREKTRNTRGNGRITQSDDNHQNEPIDILPRKLTDNRGYGARKAMGSKRSSPMARSGVSPSGPSPSTIPVVLNIPVRTLPDLNLCRVNSHGMYGTDRGVKYVVNYSYSLEVETGTTLEKVEQVIVPAIERAAVNKMIPEMFNSLCGSSRGLQSGLLPIELDPLYLGITSLPSDFVLRDVGCELDFSQPCFVISSAVTTYSEGKSAEDVEAEMETLLDDIFSIGNLANAVPLVNGVSFRELAFVSTTASPTTASPTAQQSLAIEIPERSPIFLSPISPPPTTRNQPAAIPTPIPTLTSVSPPFLAVTARPTFLPPPTSQPTVKPSEAATQEAASEESENNDDKSVGGLSDWWRWLLLCAIVVFMTAAVYFVYKSCPGRAKQHQTFEEQEEPTKF